MMSLVFNALLFTPDANLTAVGASLADCLCDRNTGEHLVSPLDRARRFSLLAYTST